MTIRRFIAPIMTVLAVCYGISVAVADEFDEGQIKITREALKGKKVGFVPLSMGFDLPQAWYEGLKRDSEKWGYEVIVRDPNWNVQAGAQALNELIAEKPDVLIFHPLDMQAYAKLVKKAMDDGINVIQINLKSPNNGDAYVGANWYEIGAESGRAARQGLRQGQRQERQGRDRAGRADDGDQPDRHSRLRGCHEAASRNPDRRQSVGRLGRHQGACGDQHDPRSRTPICAASTTSGKCRRWAPPRRSRKRASKAKSPW